MSISLYEVTWDCANAKDQAHFWSTVLDKPVMEGASEGFAAIGLQDPPAPARTGCSSRFPKERRPRTRSTPDLIISDLEAEVNRLVGAGAVKKGAFEENGARWVTLVDPEGNEFDLVTETA